MVSYYPILTQWTSDLCKVQRYKEMIKNIGRGQFQTYVVPYNSGSVLGSNFKMFLSISLLHIFD